MAKLDMPLEVDITPELQSRIDAIAGRSSLSPSEVVKDALENGHSLAWQERFLDKVSRGVAQADAGQFASQSDKERVLNKYRPA